MIKGPRNGAKFKTLSQFAYRGTNSMHTNRIYTIVLIRHNETQVPSLEFHCLWLIKIDNRIEVRVHAICAPIGKLNTNYIFSTSPSPFLLLNNFYFVLVYNNKFCFFIKNMNF